MSTALAPAALAETPTAGAAVWTGLIGLAVAMGIGRFAFTPLLPLMQQDAGVSLVQGSWLATNPATLLFAALCVGGTFMVITMAGIQEARRASVGRSQRGWWPSARRRLPSGRLPDP
jgi:hypothetical protein